MFMGKAQLVELSLKNILETKYRYDENRIKRWTLGTAIIELEKCGLRQDFIVLLKDLNEHRVYIAHEPCARGSLCSATRPSPPQSRAASFRSHATIPSGCVGAAQPVPKRTPALCGTGVVRRME
jgi:hypothetical protein